MTKRKLLTTGLALCTIGGTLFAIGVARNSLKEFVILPRYAYLFFLFIGLSLMVGGAGAFFSSLIIEPIGARLSGVMYGDPARPHICAHAQPADLSGLNNLYLRYFAGQVPSVSLMRSWLNRCPTAFTLVYRLTKDGGLVTKKELVGSFKLLPLTTEGVRALESREVSGSTFRPDHICAYGSDQPAAYYVGDVVGTTKFSSAVVLTHVDGVCATLGETVIYARPLTKDGLRAMKKRGFVQACEGEPAPEIEQLCRVCVRGDQHRGRRLRLRPLSRDLNADSEHQPK